MIPFSQNQPQRSQTPTYDLEMNQVNTKQLKSHMNLRTQKSIEDVIFFFLITNFEILITIIL